MDTLDVLKNIQKLVNFFLRYVVAGGSAVLAFGLMQKDTFGFLRVGNEISVSLLLLYISVIGPAIYSIHKGILDPLILWCVIYPSLTIRHKDKVRYCALDFALAKQLGIWIAGKDPWMRAYEGWAAQIHFLYCSAWGITFALFLSSGFSWCIFCLTKPDLVIYLLLFAAVVSDYRLTNQQVKRCIHEKVRLLKFRKKPRNVADDMVDKGR